MKKGRKTDKTVTKKSIIFMLYIYITFIHTHNEHDVRKITIYHRDRDDKYHSQSTNKN